MQKKIFTLVTVFVVAILLGFGLLKDDPSKNAANTQAPVIDNSGISNLIEGAKYNPDNINAIWTESFDGTFPPTGWLNYQESGTGLWTQASTSAHPTGFTPHSGSGMAEFKSWTYTTGASASLISSSFSLTSGTAKLGFWMLRDAGYATNADKVDFMINTTASSTGATMLGTINRSKSLAPVETGADGWYYYEFAIPGSFNTATNYLIMKSTSAYGNDMYVDDVAVSYLLTNDVGVVSVDVASPILPGSLTPKATVKNYGSAVQTFPVTMSITPGGYTSTQNVTALAANGTYQVSFANWTPTNGVYTVKVITQLTTDQDKTNDTLVKTVNVTSSTWTAGAPITSGSYLGTGVGYSPAGNDTTWLFAIAGNAPNGTSTLKYNVKTNVWSTMAPLPATRVVLASAIVKDTLYAIGGSDGTNYQTTLYKYNIKSNTWTTGTPLPGLVGWCKAQGYQDSLIYVVGGYSGSVYYTDVLIYNTISGTWRNATPLTTGKFGGAFAITGNYMVYTGGASASGVISETSIGLISQTDRSVITWSAGPAYPAGTMFRFDAAPWAYDQIMVTTGSPTTAWTPATPMPAYYFKPSTSTWTTGIALPTPVLGAYVGSTKAGNIWKFIVASGYSGTAAVTNTQIFTETVTGITSNTGDVPKEFALKQNYPNPFNPVTNISFDMPKAGFVSIKVYNMLGAEVATIVNETRQAGSYTVNFNASQLSSGMYFYKLQSGNFSDVKKMMLIK